MDRVVRMIQEIEAEARYTSHLIGKDALDPKVMEAMRRVPREKFVGANMQPFAYDNRPLPIGHGQTISQPYIVALMTDLLQLREDSVVLEVGAGCGYQAAILSLLAQKVYAIEIVAELANSARSRLQRLGYTNVEIRAADGYFGWKEHAPYDGITVAAATSSIPPPLVQQLKPGGRLVIPVGGPYFYQDLILIQKNEQGKVKTRNILGVSFVPLTGDHTVPPGETGAG